MFTRKISDLLLVVDDGKKFEGNVGEVPRRDVKKGVGEVSDGMSFLKFLNEQGYACTIPMPGTKKQMGQGARHSDCHGGREEERGGGPSDEQVDEGSRSQETGKGKGELWVGLR